MGDGGRAIAEALTTNTTLTYLNLDRMFYCVESYGIWHVITGATYDKFSIPGDAYEAIAKMLQRNKELKQHPQQQQQQQ